ADMERLRTQLGTVQDRIESLQVQGDSPGFLKIFSAAQTPQTPASNGLKKKLAILIAFAGFMCIAIPIALEELDQRIFYSADVERVLGFRPVGIVLERDSSTKEFAEEHFRRLIHGIHRGVVQQRAKIIVFTSVKAPGSTHKLVAEIGHALVARGFKAVV